MKNTILTFTENSLERILDGNEDRDWVLNATRAKSCKYLVCCHSQGEKRGTAFLVGKIEGVRFIRLDSVSNKKRWAVQFSEWANIDIPCVWGGWQNPVHYTSLEEMDINLSDLKFQVSSKLPKPTESILSLTIAQAKAGLANHYDVSLENIEISIRG